jgi:branched-chain amino acid transport system ATP-binding protein
MLQIENLHFSIGDTSILNGVNLTVKKGERLGLIGPNGSGKTTLFNCLNGFNLPQTGSITFKEQLITNLASHKRANLGLGRVFQNFGIFKEMTLLENIITAIESKKPSSFLPWGKLNKINQAEAMKYLALVGQEKRANDKASSLSGGQMRLLEITRSIAFGADLFLLDEPTAGVSPKMKQEVEKTIIKLQELGKTILIIEHDINFIQKLCERIVVLDQGKVVMDGTPEEVRSDKRLQEIYFGTNNGNNGSEKQSTVKTASSL